MTLTQNMVFKSPVGDIKVGKIQTPTSGATVSANEIGKNFKKLSEKGIVVPIDDEKSSKDGTTKQ